MALALLLGTLLAIAGLLVTSIQGFAVASGLAAARPIARALMARHVGYAIPAVLFSLFSQSMVIFYFIGTGKLVKDETAGFSEPERRRILATLKDLKRRTSRVARRARDPRLGVRRGMARVRRQRAADGRPPELRARRGVSPYLTSTVVVWPSVTENA